MQAVKLLLAILLLLQLAACGSDEQSSPTDQNPPPKDQEPIVQPLDTDNDGVEDELDCDIHNPDRFLHLTYQYVDLDSDSYYKKLPFPNSICSGEQLPSGYLSPQANVEKLDCDDTDSERYQLINYEYIDEDGDGFAQKLDSPIEACVGKDIPKEAVTDLSKYIIGDCDDSPMTGAARFRLQTLFSDNDKDGVGDLNMPTTMCIGAEAPSGYSEHFGDCNDENASVFQLLNYKFTDQDADGYLFELPNVQSICTGTSLPNGLLLSGEGYEIGDCNDSPIDGSQIYRAVKLFNDHDGDSYGSGKGITQCIGKSIPQRFSVSDSDCDDTNKNRFNELQYRYIDADRDGYGNHIHAIKTYCGADSLPDHLFYDLPLDKATDCNDSNSKVFQTLQYRFTDKDKDGYGKKLDGGVNLCTGESLPEGLFSTFAGNKLGDCNDNDPNQYRLFSYQHVDYDLDNHLVRLDEVQEICTTNQLSPTLVPYVGSRSVGDCDDTPETGKGKYRTVTLFDDLDKDGLGSGLGQAMCIGASIPEFKSEISGDCNDNYRHYYQMLSYKYIDKDRDWRYIEAEPNSTVCSGSTLPEGYSNELGRHPLGDCDDTPETGKFIHTIQEVYTDKDGDRYGTGDALAVCLGDSISPYASNSVDCDDSNKNLFFDLTYLYRDKDGDGYLIKLDKPQTVCSKYILPNGYFKERGSHPVGDCDDDPITGKDTYRLMNLYSDTDNDGYGTGQSDEYCVGKSLPEKRSISSSDCDDTNENVWRFDNAMYQDLDGDHFLSKLEKPLKLCIGDNFEYPYRKTAPAVIDCDETDFEAYRNIALFTDQDGDGIGTSTSIKTMCIGAQTPTGYSQYSGDQNDNDASIILNDAENEQDLSIILKR